MRTYEVTMVKVLSVFFCVCVILQPIYGSFDETCRTINGGVGKCMSVRACKSSRSKSFKSMTTGYNIGRSNCGYSLVCCPLHGLKTFSLDSPTIVTTTSKLSRLKPAIDDSVMSLPDPPECGVTKGRFNRIISGNNADLGDFPWMALLGYKLQNGSIEWKCGGSLITSRHVLTAAHCINDEDLYVVRLGELDLARKNEGARPVDVLIKQKIKHEHYSSTVFANDIGILVLQREVQFTDLIKPICIPKDSKLRGMSFDNYNPFIAGWGRTAVGGSSATHLQFAQIPVVNYNRCSSAYYELCASKWASRKLLCAGYLEGGIDTCQGDSGGPLMMVWDSFFYQIGTVSYGSQCGKSNAPGVYTRISYYVPWIEEKVRELKITCDL